MYCIGCLHKQFTYMHVSFVFCVCMSIGHEPALLSKDPAIYIQYNDNTMYVCIYNTFLIRYKSLVKKQIHNYIVVQQSKVKKEKKKRFLKVSTIFIGHCTISVETQVNLEVTSRTRHQHVP